MSTSALLRVSNNFLIVSLNAVGSWCLCGLFPNFLYYSSNVVM